MPVRSRHCISERICPVPYGRGEMSLGETLGRRRGAMTWSQENCLIDNRRQN